MTDIIERAQALLAEWFDPQPERFMGARGTIRALVAALKAAQEENQRLHSVLGEERLTEWLIERQRLRGEAK
jgi:hypothetical protein